MSQLFKIYRLKFFKVRFVREHIKISSDKIYARAPLYSRSRGKNCSANALSIYNIFYVLLRIYTQQTVKAKEHKTSCERYIELKMENNKFIVSEGRSGKAAESGVGKKDE
jgi:hypothetical protein